MTTVGATAALARVLTGTQPPADSCGFFPGPGPFRTVGPQLKGIGNPASRGHSLWSPQDRRGDLQHRRNRNAAGSSSKTCGPRKAVRRQTEVRPFGQNKAWRSLCRNLLWGGTEVRMDSNMLVAASVQEREEGGSSEQGGPDWAERALRAGPQGAHSHGREGRHPHLVSLSEGCPLVWSMTCICGMLGAKIWTSAPPRLRCTSTLQGRTSGFETGPNRLHLSTCF